MEMVELLRVLYLAVLISSYTFNAAFDLQKFSISFIGVNILR